MYNLWISPEVIHKAVCTLLIYRSYQHVIHRVINILVSIYRWVVGCSVHEEKGVGAFGLPVCSGGGIGRVGRDQY